MEMSAINSKVEAARRRLGSNYGDIVKCVIFHEKILE